ncbi:MAG: hypothetical protein ABIO16_07395 [Nocardioides sp.]
MRGRRTAVALLLLAALATGCDGTTSSGAEAPEPDATTPGPVAIPELTGRLEVRVVTGLRVFGLGCRQRTEHDACSPDGSATYTWLAPRSGARPKTVTVTGVRMHPDRSHRAWVVAIRFARHDRVAVRRAARHAIGAGGYTLVLDDHTGDALQAAGSMDARGDRIVVRDLTKPAAWDLVSGYVTAATPR